MQLKYSASTEYRIRDLILAGILALMMGAGAVWNAVSAFGLSWKPQDMISGGITSGMRLVCRPTTVWEQRA